MRVIIVESAADVATLAAERIASVIRERQAEGKAAVLGVATGSSPLGTYSALAEILRSENLNLAGVSAFALDEYVGIPREHPESYFASIRRTVTEPLGLHPDLVHVPDGLAEDLEAACEEFEQKIFDAGGIDLQLLGIGSNGHIGFNEPTSSLSSRTRPKTLAPQTIADNARFFGSADEVPIHCLTQGIGTILDADQLLLVAQGAGKADAIAAMIEGPLASVCPASALQLHPDATVIIDSEAAGGLKLHGYYEHVELNLPHGSQLR